MMRELFQSLFAERREPARIGAVVREHRIVAD